MKTFLRSLRTGLAATTLLASLPAAVWAAESAAPSGADELRALREQLRLLDAKVRALEEKQAQRADTATLEKKLLVLERRQEIQDDRVSITDKGFTLSSADGANFLRLRGLVQADARYFFNQDPALTNNAAFLLRRARLIFEGTLNKDTSFLIVPDFALNSTTTLQIVDAYINYAIMPGLQLRAGRFREPVGLEALQSDSTAFFVERSLVSSLLPKRDIGFQLGGDLLNGTLNYAVGIFDGVADGSDNTSNTETDNDKDAAVRLFAQPFKNDVASPLRGLGFGIGASYGREKPVAANLTSGYKTDGQQTFFSYRAVSTAAASKTNFSTVADGHTWRVSPQAYFYRGPFGLLGEYALSVVNVRPSFPASLAGSPKVELKNTAWQLAMSYVLTGEDAAYTGVVPKTNFSWADGTWGAWEVVARYESLDLDNAAFVSPGAGYSSVADKNNNATKVSSLGLGLNWYLSKTVRFSLDYFHSAFDLTAGAVPTTRALLNHDESALITRFQIAF